MASPGAIRAGKGEVELSVIDKTRQGLNSARKELQSFGTRVMSFGAALEGVGKVVAGALLVATYAFSEMGSDMLDMSQRTGVTVEALSELRHAADQSGASAEILEKGFVGLTKFMTAAAQAGSAESKALHEMGLSFDEVSAMSGDQRFEAFAEAISKIENPTRRMAAAMDVFGKSGVKMLPMLMDGRNGIQALREEARRMGVAMSSQDAQAAESLGDQLSLLVKQVKFLIFHVGAAVAPIAKQFLGAIILTTAGVIHWISDNRALIATIFKVALVVSSVGSTIFAAGLIIYGLGTAIGWCSAMIGVVWTGALFGAKIATILYSAVVSACAFVIGLFTGATYLSITALLALGIGLAAILIIGALVFVFFEDIAELLGGWGPIFEHIGAIFAQVWGGILSALSAGELQLAAQIAMAGFSLLWAQGINWIKDAWFSFSYFFMNTWDSVTTWLAHALVTVSSTITEVFISIAETTEDIFIGIVGSIAGEIDNLIELLPDFIKTELGLTTTGFDAAALNEANQMQRVTDRVGRQNGVADMHREIDRDANRGERERARLHAVERERARLEEAGLRGDLDFLLAEADVAAIVADMDRENRLRLLGGVGDDDPTRQEFKESVQGTFSADAAFGMLGAETPMARIERQGQEQILQGRQMIELLERIAEADQVPRFA